MDLPGLGSPLGLVGLALLAIALLAAGVLPVLRRIPQGAALGIAVSLLAFQAFHLLEHLIQLGYWVLHPTAPPYMTPWALDGVDGLAAWFALLPVDASAMAGGMEGLHLVGNLLFFVGIVALDRSTPSRLPGVRTAMAIQGVHLAEHVLLTGTLVLFGEAVGISTLFGAADGTSWGASVRVWFHFLINLAGTIPAAIALRARFQPDVPAADDAVDLRKLAPAVAH